MSVNAVNGEFIQEMGIANLEDLSQFIPGLERPRLAQKRVCCSNMLSLLFN